MLYAGLQFSLRTNHMQAVLCGERELFRHGQSMIHCYTAVIMASLRGHRLLQVKSDSLVPSVLDGDAGR